MAFVSCPPSCDSSCFHPTLLPLFKYFFCLFLLLSHSDSIPKPRIKHYKHGMVTMFVITRLVFFNGNLQEKDIPWESSEADKEAWKVQRRQHQKSIRYKAGLNMGKNKWSEDRWCSGSSLTACRDHWCQAHGSFLVLFLWLAEKCCDGVMLLFVKGFEQRVHGQQSIPNCWSRLVQTFGGNSC